MSKTAWIWIIVIVVVVIIGFMLVGSGNKANQAPVVEQSVAPSVEQSPTAAQPSTQSSVEPSLSSSVGPVLQPTGQTSSDVTINNFTFTPATLTVKAGTTVTWTNQDSVAHQIKGDTFNSAKLNTGDTFKFTFSTPGTFNYICSIHPMMKGSIVVQ